ncbi:GLPGLI family protein [Mucilaginibacter ginkgonis]|uniref:GLPGLI family protein n=1 Tax=Mucilaginibacter ginkgonis TaxID=2682091 RepID=A0A6I4INI4_9SPHI|nr:GLPGLI family protein [Mucilaginibacter ginkgonis]QQL49595.1 GLPGLI family protein [Mucilaginibacter ginkgonis]
MKKLNLIFAALSLAGTALAQKPEMAQAIVHYNFTHVRDTTNREHPYTEKMTLFLGPTASVYRSYDRKLQDAMMRQQAAEQMAAQKGSGQVTLKLTGNRPTTRAEIFQFPTVHKMYRKEQLLATMYLIEDQLPIINWKISADTTSFGTLHCQKATGHLGGRDYTAWFCPDLPYHTGPWKLSGLPGLIVEAYDAKKDVIFKFDGMEEAKATPVTETTTSANPDQIKLIGSDSNKDPNLIALPADAAKTTDKEYTKLQEAMRKDPQAFMGSMGGGMRMMPQGGAPSSPSPGMPQSVNIISAPRTAATNNPLELPEKK